uniref:Chromodomain-helicase-DNA-binding protein 9 n=1 Tax=Sphaerodactylus townsendi TaxID=933632 RepID=A0ACB8EAC2_9SAUR
MTDPMMDFFDDANLFSDTLEGLSDDAFVQTGPVSLVDELNLGAEFEPLHIGSLNHVQETQTQQKMNEFEQLNQYDSLKLQVSQSFSSPAENVLSPHSQFNCSPIHPQSQTNGMFPDVADGSPMWGHQTSSSVSNQNGSPFHQGHSQPMQQNKTFVAHHDFALFQASEQHHPCVSLQSQQNRNGIDTGEDTRSSSDNFMEVNTCIPHRTSVPHPPQAANPSNPQPSVSIQSFSQTANDSPHYCGNQERSFGGHSPSITSCSVNSTQFSPPYSYSSNHISPTTLLQPSAALSTSQQTHPLSDFAGNDAFAPQTGTKPENTDNILNSSTSLNSDNFHVLRSTHPQGNFSSSKLSAVNMNFSVPAGSSPQMSHFSDTIEGNGFASLDENLLRQVESQAESFTELDPETLLQEDLLPQFDESAFVQDSSSNELEHDLEHNVTPQVTKSHLIRTQSQNCSPWNSSDSSQHPQERKRVNAQGQRLIEV